MQCITLINLGMRFTLKNRTVLIATLSCLIPILASCSAYMYGYTRQAAVGRFLSVDQTNESFGYKRLDYTQGVYPMLKHFVALYGIPELIYEFDTDDKKEGIRLFYVKKDMVYEFVKMGLLMDSLLMKEQRHLTAHEKATYQELKGKILTANAKPGQEVLTRADLDSLVASQRYDTVIAFLHTPHDAQTVAWLQPWWGERMKEAHVPLIYELAFQSKDPEKSMQVFGIAYVGTVLDGCLCTEPAVNRLRVSMLQQYMKAWPLRTNWKSSADFGHSFTSAVHKGLAFYAGIYGRKSKTPYPGWACRETGIYDQPAGTVMPQGEWDSTRSATLKRFNQIMNRDLVVAVTSETPSQKSLIDEFLERSYLRQEVSQSSEQMTKQQATKTTPTGSEADTKALALNREMEEALRPESTVPLMQDYLRTQRPETLEHLLEWLRTPLAQRMLTLAAQPFDYSGFNTYQVPKQGLLLDLIPRLDKATHTSELAIEDTTERTKFLAPIFTGKEQAPRSDSKLSPMIEQFLRAQLLRKQAFIYRAASDQDLQRYIEFLESPLGQTYVTVRRNTLVAAYSRLQTVVAKLPALVQSVK